MARAKKDASALDPKSFAQSLSIDPTDDYEVAECWAVLSNDSETQQAMNAARVRLNRIVLGDRFADVMSAIRDANGGNLPVAEVNGFVNSVISESGKLKNSQGSDGA